MVDQKQSVYVKGQGPLFTDPKSGENIVLRGFANHNDIFYVHIAAKCPFEFPDFKACDRSDTMNLGIGVEKNPSGMLQSKLLILNWVQFPASKIMAMEWQETF